MLGTARRKEARTYLEEVEERAGVETGLLVDGRHERALSGALGVREVERSNLRPWARWFSASTWVRRTLVVVHAWVKTRPWGLSVYFASISPPMRLVFAFCEPATLNVTLEGVEVFASSEVPEK